jgi:hypothetical protein
MGIKKSLATCALAAILGGLWVPTQATAGENAAVYEQAIEAARAAQKAAASVGGEWRDTGKLIKEADAAAKAGDYGSAIRLADEARQQGELGYEQALTQKDVGLPPYLKK